MIGLPAVSGVFIIVTLTLTHTNHVESPGLAMRNHSGELAIGSRSPAYIHRSEKTLLKITGKRSKVKLRSTYT
jgi:hypothetical protein